MATMCEVIDEERMRAVPFMLSGDDLTYNSSGVRQYKTYEHAIDTLGKWYNSVDERSGVVIKRRSMSSTKTLMNRTNYLGVDVLRKFVSRLMSLQKQ